MMWLELWIYQADKIHRIGIDWANALRNRKRLSCRELIWRSETRLSASGDVSDHLHMILDRLIAAKLRPWNRSRARPWDWSNPWCGSSSWCRGGSWCWRCSSCGGRGWRGSRSRCSSCGRRRCGSLSSGKYANVINIFLVLIPVRVEVKRGGIGDIATRLIRNNGNVVAYLILIRIALERVERIAHRNIS